MSQTDPWPKVADRREAGSRCPHCGRDVEYGDQITTCSDCGTVHHWSCWESAGGCGGYDCAPAQRSAAARSAPTMTITDADLARAMLLPTSGRPAADAFPPTHDPWSTSPRANVTRTDRMAIGAFIVALAGIPFFGALTGLVAMVLGSWSLGTIRKTRQRGTGFAVAGIVLGLADVVGWVIFLSVMLSHPARRIHMDEFQPDAAALDHLAPSISRAMRANAWIETMQRPGVPSGIGSGVLLSIREGEGWIVTNRHVVDPDFDGSDAEEAAEQLPDGHLLVRLLGQPAQPARIVWRAPNGIDLAIVKAGITTGQVTTALWQAKPELAVGQPVFAVGNPQGLGWTHTQGVISQFRRQQHGADEIRIIQTSAAINPGNSGGGLYDADGMLIGINTWTNDKRFSEGLSFAIVFDELLTRAPAELKLSDLSQEMESDRE